MNRPSPLRLARITTLTALLVLATAGNPVGVQAAVTTLNWQQLNTTPAPQGREFAAMDYDSAHGRTVLFGGDNNTPGSAAPPNPNFADTWEWDGTSWVQKFPSVSPPGLTAAAMAFDGVSVLFGGETSSGAMSGATWAWDGTTWTLRDPAASPSARVWTAMASDSKRGRIVLFGGSTSSGPAADTWEYDGTTWTQRFPASSPPARYGEAMAFDSARNVTVMFGGYYPGTGRLSDTWEWDGNNWTQRVSTANPYPRWSTSMAFDSATGKTILFGGDHLRPFALGPINDTWEWDGNQWVQDWTDSVPTGRLGESMVYDSLRSRMVMFGGTVGGNPFQFPNDTSELGSGIVTPAGNPDASFMSFSGFPPVEVGATYSPGGAFISSQGTGPAHIASITATGDFAIQSTDCPLAPNPFAVGSYCTVLLSFTPTAAGTRTGTLVLVDDGPGGGAVAPLSATGTPASTTLSVDQASAAYGGTTTISATLNAKGGPVAGAAVSFTLPNGATATVTTDSRGVATWTGAGVVGIHAGFYFGGIQATYAGDADHKGSSGFAALVVAQVASLTYGGDFYVNDTAGARLSVIVDQRTPASDPRFLDFNSFATSVRFDVAGPGGPSVVWVQVVDASDWSTSGRGVATASLPVLADGAYTVSATMAGQFVTGEDARGAFVSSPTRGGFLSGGGAIASGNFAFQVNPGRSPQGNLVYVFRTRTDAGGGPRDVDVVVTSSDVVSLSGNSHLASSSGHFSVAVVDSLTGVYYTDQEFAGGMFTLTVADGGSKNADGFALQLTRPDGTTYYTTAPVSSRGDVPLSPVLAGNIVSSL